MKFDEFLLSDIKKNCITFYNLSTCVCVCAHACTYMVRFECALKIYFATMALQQALQLSFL